MVLCLRSVMLRLTTETLSSPLPSPKIIILPIFFHSSTHENSCHGSLSESLPCFHSLLHIAHYPLFFQEMDKIKEVSFVDPCLAG